MQKDKSVSNSRKAYIGAMKGMMALSVAVTCGLRSEERRVGKECL